MKFRYEYKTIGCFDLSDLDKRTNNLILSGWEVVENLIFGRDAFGRDAYYRVLRKEIIS